MGQPRKTNGGGYGGVSTKMGYQTWSFGPSILMRLFDSLFGSEERPDGKHSMCAKDVKRLTTMYPEHREILNVAGRYIEGQEAIVGAMETDTKHKKMASKLGEKLRNAKFDLMESKKELNREKSKTARMKSEIYDLEAKISQLSRETDRAKEEASKAKIEFEKRLEMVSEGIRMVSDKSFRRGSPLAWGQGIDSLWNDLPDALSLVDLDERIRPSDASRELAEISTFVDEDGVSSVSFVAAKRERGEARWSEDRVGFQRRAGGFRAVALDGVGGSVHSRHLVRSIAKELLESEEVASVVQGELEKFGRSMASDEVSFGADEKLEFFQRERLQKGSSCVLAVADYDKSSGSVTVSQIGDTVAFVEVDDGEWRVVPEEFGSGKEFDTSPIQVSTKDIRSTSEISVTTIENATGRVAVATDGIADFIIGRVGMEEFIDMIELEDGDAQGLLDKLRKEEIADDDLSFLMASFPSST
jgi:hypothetical protein